jgi:predicted methyltransferase
MKCTLLSRPLSVAHSWISQLVSPGDTVIDATAGNGHDTVFLARLAGESGKVHAFDIQHSAIISTKELLIRENLWSPAIQLHETSHADMKHYVTDSAKAIMFNLGYLPGGDKSIITHPASTLKALRESIELLEPNGILSVMCYPGHPGGDQEAELIEQFMASLPHHSWRTGKYQLLNTSMPAPFQLAAFRLN